MNSYDKMKTICQYYGIIKPEKFRKPGDIYFYPGELSTLGYYPSHKLLDEVDKISNYDTRGSILTATGIILRRPGPECPNVGARIKMHMNRIANIEIWEDFKNRSSYSHWGLHW